jgi:hypothetical protein
MSLFFRRLRFLLALIFVLLVTAYSLSRLGYFEWPREYDPLALPDLDAAPNLLTPFKLKFIDSSAENCRAAFARAGKAVAIEPERTETAQCIKQDTIKLASLSAAKLNVEETRCAIARTRSRGPPPSPRPTGTPRTSDASSRRNAAANSSLTDPSWPGSRMAGPNPWVTPLTNGSKKRK